MVAGDLAFPNGMAITADGGTLVVAESHASRLTAFDIGPDGGLDGRRVWADTAGDHPDGICVDDEGAIWYADVATGRCVRVREGGQVLATVELDRGAFSCTLSRGDQPQLYVVGQQWGGPQAAEPTGTGGRVPGPGAGRGQTVAGGPGQRLPASENAERAARRGPWRSRGEESVQGAVADVQELGIVGRVGQEDDREVERPAPGSGPQRRPFGGVGSGGLVGGAEGGVVPHREQHPGDGQVGRGVARGDVAEVDHAADMAVADQDVGGVQVAVQPARRAAVAGRGQRRRPGAARRRPVDLIGQQPDVGREYVGPGGERNAAVGVGGGVRRGGRVQRAEEAADRVGRARQVEPTSASAAGSPGRYGTTLQEKG